MCVHCLRGAPQLIFSGKFIVYSYQLNTLTEFTIKGHSSVKLSGKSNIASCSYLTFVFPPSYHLPTFCTNWMSAPEARRYYAPPILQLYSVYMFLLLPSILVSMSAVLSSSSLNYLSKCSYFLFTIFLISSLFMT